MNIGYYYHVPASFSSSHVRVPAWIGIYAAELARQAGRLTFYLHDDPTDGTEDFPLPVAVRAVNLGRRRSAPLRTFAPAHALRNFRPSNDAVDVMLVRGPTPLLPALVRASDVPTALYLVADFGRVPLGRANPRWRNALIARWIRIYQRLQRKASRGRLVLANSPAFAETVESFDDFEIVISSLLPEHVFDESLPENRRWNPAKGTSESVGLLYTGRIVEEKGLFQAVEAIRVLVDRGVDVRLEVVGKAVHESIQRSLEATIDKHRVNDRVVFSPFVPAGQALWSVYRSADIFLFPSILEGEGFPHSVLEAMAASLPVVATKVGGVPLLLRDGEQALLVEPRSPKALADAVERVVREPQLRSKLSSEGWAWARQHTLERCATETIRHLDDLLRKVRR